jgi:hypothetical protein
LFGSIDGEDAGAIRSWIVLVVAVPVSESDVRMACSGDCDLIVGVVLSEAEADADAVPAVAAALLLLLLLLLLFNCNDGIGHNDELAVNARLIRNNDDREEKKCSNGGMR